LSLLPFVQVQVGIPRLTTLLADYYTRNLETTKDIIAQLPEELIHRWLIREWINFGCFTYDKLMKIANPEIRRLELTKLKGLKNVQEVIDLLKKCSSLLELNLRNQHRLHYPAPITEDRSSHIDEEDLKKARKMTQMLQETMKTHPLRSLTLPGFLHPDALKQLIVCVPNLVTLDISDLTLKRRTLEFVLKRLNSLQNICIGSYPSGKSKWTPIDSIANILGPRLRSLRGPTTLSLCSLNTLAQMCPNLEVLEGIHYPILIMVDSTDNSFRPHEVIQTFAKSCTKLSVFRCELSKNLLGELISNAPQLTELCARLADDETLSKLVTCCPKLRTLDLVFNSCVTDTGVQTVVEGCKCLSTLLLTGCCNITPSFMSRLRHSGLQLDR
jgi:hypothetical protein